MYCLKSMLKYSKLNINTYRGSYAPDVSRQLFVEERRKSKFYLIFGHFIYFISSELAELMTDST